MKYASIDIGTNTVLMLIAERENGRLKDVTDLAVITRLGKGLKQTGVISQGRHGQDVLDAPRLPR